MVINFGAVVTEGTQKLNLIKGMTMIYKSSPGYEFSLVLIYLLDSLVFLMFDDFSATANVLLQMCYCKCATANVLLQMCYCKCATANVLLQMCYCKCATANVLLQMCYCKCATANVLLQMCYCKCDPNRW